MEGPIRDTARAALTDEQRRTLGIGTARRKQAARAAAARRRDLDRARTAIRREFATQLQQAQAHVVGRAFHVEQEALAGSTAGARPAQAEETE